MQDESFAGFTLLCGTISVFSIYKSLQRFFWPMRFNSVREKYPFQTTFELLANSARFFDWYIEFYDKMRKELNTESVSFEMFGLPTFVTTNNVRNIEYILRDNFKNFGKGSALKRRFQNFLGDGIFNIDGQQWFAHRKTSSHLFKLENFKTTMLNSFNQDLDTVVKVLNKSIDNQSSLNIQDVMHKFTMESIGRIALGCDLHTFDEGQATYFGNDFDYVTQQVSDSFRNPLWLLKRYLSPAGWKFFACLSRLDTFCYKIIQERRKSLESGEDSSKGDLLSLYLNKKNYDGEDSSKNDTWIEPTDRNIRDVVLNIMLAGRDTTAQGLSWAIYRLCLHPENQILIREELQKIRQNTPSQSSNASWLSYQQLQHLDFLEAFCLETIRLHPPVGSDTKCVYEQDTLPDGNVVYPGDFVTYNPYYMGRSVELWGETALEFDPNRFLNKAKPSPYMFTAFQAGPRMCLGQNFAILEMKCCLARILSEFNVELAQDPSTVTYLRSLTMPIKGGLLVKFKPVSTVPQN